MAVALRSPLEPMFQATTLCTPLTCRARINSRCPRSLFASPGSISTQRVAGGLSVKKYSMASLMNKRLVSATPEKMGSPGAVLLRRCCTSAT